MSRRSPRASASPRRATNSFAVLPVPRPSDMPLRTDRRASRAASVFCRSTVIRRVYSQIVLRTTATRPWRPQQHDYHRDERWNVVASGIGTFDKLLLLADSVARGVGDRGCVREFPHLYCDREDFVHAYVDHKRQERFDQVLTLTARPHAC